MDDEFVIDKKEYFNNMCQTTNLTIDYMNQKLLEIKKSNKELYNKIKINPVMKKRLSKKHPKLRPFLIRLSYELGKGSNWKRIIPVCAAAEFLNISTYLTNAIFDEKGNLAKKEEIDEYILISMILRDISSECLLDIDFAINGDDLKIIQNKLNQINKLIYVGQFKDLFQLKKEKFHNFKNFENMIEEYDDRCIKFTGHFMENLAYIGGKLANMSNYELDALSVFGLNLGQGDQIVNDLGDFTISNIKALDFEKDYKDLFSDFKQGKLTLPIIYLLKNDESNKISNLFGKKDLSFEEINFITKSIIENNIDLKIKEYSKKNYFLCKKQLKIFSDSNAKKQLSIMASLLRSNKYFSHFRELRVLHHNTKIN